MATLADATLGMAPLLRMTSGVYIDDQEYTASQLVFYFPLLRAKLLQLCSTLCNPMDCSLPGSSVPGILQARILEWVAISFSKGSSRPRDPTQILLH